MVLDNFNQPDDVVYLLFVVDFSLLKRRNLDFNLFVQQDQLFVPFNQLCTQDVPLSNHHLVVFLLLLLLSLCLSDNVFQPGDIVLLGLDHFVAGRDVLIVLGFFAFELCILVCICSLSSVFILFLAVFRGDLFFKLVDILGHYLELHLQRAYLLLGLQQVLTIEIAVRSDGFVKVLLLFQPRFSLNILFLQLLDNIVFYLNLL